MRVDQDARIREGKDIAREGEIQGLIGQTICYRCLRPIETAHDGEFCPAFAQPSEAGRWLLFDNIRRSLIKRARGTISIKFSNRVEEPEGPYGVFHRVVGISFNGKYAGRLDTPYVPEFSVWEGGNDIYGLPTTPSHELLWGGWRNNLRRICDRSGADWWKVSRDLGISPDRSTEHGLRWMAGRL